MAEKQTTWAQRVPQQDVLADVSSRIAALFRSRWGRGPEKCRAHWAGPDVLFVLIDGGHTESEQMLAKGGRSDEVLAGRRAFHALAEAELCEIVEHATGRSVSAFMGSTRTDPDMSAEVFVLEPPQPALLDRAGHALAEAEERVSEAQALRAEGEQARRVNHARRRPRPSGD